MSLKLDTTHSSIEFAVRHMGLATVKGRFHKFDVTAEVNENGEPVSTKVVVDASSIDTGVADRDNHLRSPDFFDVANHPHIVFEATSFRREGDEYVVDGQLTMRGVTHPVTLRGEIAGPIKDPWGNERFAADLQGKVDRTKWGLKWNQVLEAGGLLVAEEVRFHAVVELVKVGEPVAA